MIETAANAILRGLAAEHRRVLSDWRALLVLRRATRGRAPDQRRWTAMPTRTADLTPLLRQMRERGDIAPIDNSRHFFDVTVPYAQLGFGEGHELLFEINPYATLSHFSALMFHGLTLAFPQPTFATIASSGAGAIQPLGTSAEDWTSIELPPSRTPKTINGRRAVWIVAPPEHFFGFEELRPYGYPVRVTTVERTLLDALQSPELCGGIDNVLRAWAFARDGLNIDQLVQFTDRIDASELRQRAGFILEEMGVSHPAIDAWSARSPWSESSRLDANEPYSPEINPRWNLSLNVPLAALRDEAA